MKPRRSELKERVQTMLDRRQRMKLYGKLCISRDHDLTLTIKHARAKDKHDVVDNIATFRALRIETSHRQE
jgi:hypothetical protein